MAMLCLMTNIVYTLFMIMMTVHDSDKMGKSKKKSQICLKISKQERVKGKHSESEFESRPRMRW